MADLKASRMHTVFCKKHFHDEIVDISGSANYSDESLKNNCLSDKLVDTAFTIP